MHLLVCCVWQVLKHKCIHIGQDLQTQKYCSDIFGHVDYAIHLLAFEMCNEAIRVPPRKPTLTLGGDANTNMCQYSKWYREMFRMGNVLSLFFERNTICIRFIRLVRIRDPFNQRHRVTSGLWALCDALWFFKYLYPAWAEIDVMVAEST